MIDEGVHSLRNLVTRAYDEHDEEDDTKHVHIWCLRRGGTGDVG